MTNITKCSLFLSMFFLLSCVTNASNKVISFEGVIDIPIISDGEDSDKYIVTPDLFFMKTKDTIVSFDIMNEDDVQFLGSEKLAYDFLKSAFSKPDGQVEIWFKSSYDNFSLEQKKHNDIETYILVENDESSIDLFILSKEMGFVLKVDISGENKEAALKKILNNMKLTIKD